MDDAVGGVDVRGGDLRAVDENAAFVHGNLDLAALHGDELLTVLEVLGAHDAFQDVVPEDALQLGTVLRLQQAGDGARGQRVEGLVGGREDGERAAGREGADEAACLDGGGERREVGRRDSDVVDGLARRRRRRRGRRGRGRQQHGIDDVDDAVGGVDVRGGDLRVVDENASLVDSGEQRLALNGLDDLAVRQVFGVHGGAGDDVVREHIVELLLVLGLEQVRDDARRERAEGLVGGREDGERTRRLERRDEAAGRHGGDEGREVRRCGCDVHDGLACARGGRGDQEGGDEELHGVGGVDGGDRAEL